MQVTQANAVIVIDMFTKLSDERFTMRSVNAIKKGTELTTAQVIEIAGQIGLPVRKRASDDKLFIQRNGNVAQAQEVVAKAQAVLAGGESFDLDFTPQQTAEETFEDEDLMGDIEGGLSDRTIN